jgi:diguanylate cyclase (GGDEF)-like protein
MWSNTGILPSTAMSRLPPLTPAPRATRRLVLLPRLWPLSPTVAFALAAGCGLIGAGLAWLLSALPGDASVSPLVAAAIGAFAAAVPLAMLLVKASIDLERGRHLALAAGALDPVTGVSSRAPFLALAEREFARSRRYGIGAALLLVDIDRFRRLSEGHDADAGDLVLREIAASTQATLRGADALARFGHAQVAVFLAHADPLGALDVAERIRERVEQLEIAWRDQRLRATVSVGVVLMRPAHLSLQAVIDDAEAALGAARHAGGNCVRSAPVDPRRLPQGSHGPSVGDNQAAGS